MEALPSDGAFNLLLLCHSLQAEEYSRAVALARSKWRGIKLLALTTEIVVSSPIEADLTVCALQGPVVMFEQISRLLQLPFTGYKGSGPAWR